MVLRAYERFGEKAEAGRQSAASLLALADEVNRDIRRFRQDHDLMTIIGFLKSWIPRNAAQEDHGRQLRGDRNVHP
jgi:hypothetical protein